MASIGELKEFGEAFSKLGVSAAAALKLLRSRAAAGARVAPALMQQAEQAAASGGRAPAGLRWLALEASDSVRGANRARNLASRLGVESERRGLLSRAQQFDTALAKSPTGLVGSGEGVMERVYTPGGAEFMAGKLPLEQARTLAPETTGVSYRPPPGTTAATKVERRRA